MAASDARKKGKSAGKSADDIVDPRAPLEPTPKVLEATVADLAAVVARLKPPDEPKPTDLVDAMMHITIASKGPCGWGQWGRHRIQTQYVDRNEFRLTEAFELEATLVGIPAPDLFERCDQLIQAVRQIYNEQNDVTLEFLREAQVSDRNAFLQRAVAIKPEVTKFLQHLLSFEELIFSDRSTQRVQQRLNLDCKLAHVEAFVARVRELLKPFGGLPLDVGPESNKIVSEPVLSPACLLVRLGPGGKR
ncbi:MAG: hypothetical protein R3F56_18730 [Planctomycetota bacterium]